MSMNLHIMNASGSLADRTKVIQQAFKNADALLEQFVIFTDIDIVVLDNPQMTIKEVGVGGYTPNRNLIYIYIDPSKKLDENELVYTLCHELSHAVRYKTFGFGETLYDSFVFEGLATAFEEECGTMLALPPSYVVSTIGSYPDMNDLMTKAKQHMDDKDFNYYSWFISGFDKVPRWGGYMVGYKIVKDYLAKTNKNASELLLEDQSIFVQ